MKPARILQVEIRVTDLQRSIAFYRAVFDWIITPVAADYAMLDTGKPPIGSLWQVTGTGMPLGIAHHVRSSDCVADAALAETLGGGTLVERSEVPGSGAWTATQDPWGNEFAFWQASVPGEPTLRGTGNNTFSWLELATADLETGMSYYHQLMGWTFARLDATPDYAICDETTPGVGLVGGPAGLRRHGATDFIRVTDMPTVVANISANGGTVLDDPQNLGDGSLVTLFLDPDGNKFAIVERK